MQELPFLHSARRLMLVDICMKFHDASLYGLKVIEQTRWRHDFVLLFLHFARRLMLIDICMKFREDSFRDFQVTERTRFVTDRQTDIRTPGEKQYRICLPTLRGET